MKRLVLFLAGVALIAGVAAKSSIETVEAATMERHQQIAAILGE